MPWFKAAISSLVLVTTLFGWSVSADECSAATYPCPHNELKVQICHFDVRTNMYQTRCAYEFSLINRHYEHERDYCGACAPEDDPTQGYCTAEYFPCGKKDKKVEVCHYVHSSNTYETKCMTPERYNMTHLFHYADYCGACTGYDEEECFEEELLYVEDFEYYNDSDALMYEGGWNNGFLDYDEYFTHILGRYNAADDDPNPERYFPDIPVDLEYLLVEFDFLEIDKWQYPDCLHVHINGELLDLGVFEHDVDEGVKSGYTPRGITWTSYSVIPNVFDIGFNKRHVDQIHHVSARVPGYLVAVTDGLLKLRFEPLNFGSTERRESAGFDNILITGYRSCGLCVEHEYVAYEDFENYTDAIVPGNPQGWENALIDYDENFTTFLGRLDNDTWGYDPVVTYNVPVKAEFLMVDFDFYEIDNWEGKDCLYVFINGERLDLNIFNMDVDEMYKTDYTENLIVWTADSAPNPPARIGFEESYEDQVHHVSAWVPYWMYEEGDLELRFAVRIDGLKDNESGGIDNIKITAHYECGFCLPTKLVAFDTFDYGGAEGWVNGKLADESETYFGVFMGGYDLDDDSDYTDPIKVYFVPWDAEFVKVEFDFYEIDEWVGGDCIYAYINGVELYLGIYNMDKDEGTKNGTAGEYGEIVWTSESAYPPKNIGVLENKADQIHHITAYVPATEFPLGVLELRLSTRLDKDVSPQPYRLAGFDNIQITAVYDCGPCVPNFLVAKETFEGVDEAVGWAYGKLDGGGYFTTFLGRYADDYYYGEHDPVKIYEVPPTAGYILVSFDFYEIGEWTDPDCFYVYINGDELVFRGFESDLNDGNKTNTTEGGIYYEVLTPAGDPEQIGFSYAPDQIHHVIAHVPQQNYMYTGEIVLQLSPRVNQKKEKAAAGFDNIELYAHFDCDFPTAAPSLLPGPPDLDPRSGDICSTDYSPCPHNDGKIQICHYNRREDDYTTKCVWPDTYIYRHYDHENDYCGACLPEHDPTQGYCTVDNYTCPWSEDKIQVCHYSREGYYVTKCVNEKRYNMTHEYHEYDYCGPCTDEDEGGCYEEELLEFDSFEYYDSSEQVMYYGNWTNGYLDHDEYFTQILGRYNGDDPDPEKNFTLATDWEYVLLEFDFLEIDKWEDPDCIYVYINGELVDLGVFEYNVDEGVKTGISAISPLSVAWSSYSIVPPVNIGFKMHVDQVHHVTIRVPGSLFAITDGLLNVRIDPQNRATKSNRVSAGIDNFAITGYKSCGSCVDHDYVVYEDFDSYANGEELDAQGGWTNGQIDYFPGDFGKFLGRLDNDTWGYDMDPVVTYPVPAHAESLMVEFDFYEIDNWDGEDCLYVYLNGEEINLGVFHMVVDEKYKYGLSENLIVWVADSAPNPPADLGYQSSKDQIHHVRAWVPFWLFPDGYLEMRFAVRISDLKDNESAGIDNIKITADFECGFCLPTELVAFDSFDSGDISGWVNGKKFYNEGFGDFLGAYGLGDDKDETDPVKVFFVPIYADYIQVEFDFYEIDEWRGGDCIYAYINDIELYLGIYNVDEDEGTKTGTAGAYDEIHWTSESLVEPVDIGTAHPGRRSLIPDPGAVPDQVHHITAHVPSYLATSTELDLGLLTLRLATRLDKDLSPQPKRVSGFDNVKITAHYDCGPCTPDWLIVRETFEDETLPLPGWAYGKLDYDYGFTNFLGRFDNSYYSGEHDPVRLYKVPPSAGYIILSFDFYEIDEWTDPDCFYVYINGEELVFRGFEYDLNDGNKTNTTAGGIYYEVLTPAGEPEQIGFGDAPDQIHHVIAHVPQAAYMYTGEILLQFSTRVNNDYYTVSAGYDNIELYAHFDCDFPTATPGYYDDTPAPSPYSAPPIPGRSDPDPVPDPDQCSLEPCGDADDVPFWIDEEHEWQNCQFLRENEPIRLFECGKGDQAFFYCPKVCERCPCLYPT